jgi:hypothetical protein
MSRRLVKRDPLYTPKRRAHQEMLRGHRTIARLRAERTHANRRRKLALASKRRNRGER